MEELKFRMAARCEAAGRPNNEDNYQLCEALDDGKWGFETDREAVLGDKGCLLVVADGMGGMNAGEVASALAIETIKEWFSAEKLNGEVVASAESIERHIVDAIVAADARIKKESAADKEKEGMGSTIVLAWVIDGHVYVGWCGDSRAYRFNPETGLESLSRDHSYVQELVDAGKLAPELAFDHPNNNIITRSLGDPSKKAQPDVKRFPLRAGDIVMLCSDGLSGVLHDHEIATVIAENSETLATCRDALWHASEYIGWNDNVTVELFQALSIAEQEQEQESEKADGSGQEKLAITAEITAPTAQQPESSDDEVEKKGFFKRLFGK